jgi:phenylacetate-coenzyme A ligase PaaK-like adenylate-forming protein
MVPIGAGDNLFTRMFDETLFGVPEVIEYQVVFDRKAGKDLLTVIVETEKPGRLLERKILEVVMKIPEIQQGVMNSKTIAAPSIKVVKPNTFDRYSIKQKRLIDNRNLYD